MKPIPASRMHMPTRFASSSILTPSACNTSAAPDFDDSARLPAALRVPGGGNIQKIFQHQMTMFGGNALGMKLHAMDGQAGMHQPHHESIARLGIDREFARHVCAFNHERMIARCLQRAVNASE